jgi:putative oxidoreductase
MKRLLATSDSWALTASRLALGLVMFPHGAQKMLGWFGGPGFTATMGFFTGQGIPAPLAFLAIVAEFFGSLGLIVGLLGRVAAFGIFCVMVVAILAVHLPNGFFMNWSGQQAGEGFEYHVLAIGLALAVMIGGTGAMSFDRALTEDR